MKKILIVLAIFMFLPAGALANLVTIYDTNTDRHGGDVFNVFSITVETDPAKPMYFSIATNYPEIGATVDGWKTRPADLILDVAMDTKIDYAIPLVEHWGWKNGDGSYGDKYYAGHVYNVESMWLSSAYEPSSGGYSYNNTAVSLYKGTDTGLSGTWKWISTGSTDPQIPAWNIVYLGADWDWYDLAINGYLEVYWATATCGNDTIRGTVYPNAVPEPATMLLLGTGLIGLVGFSRKKLFSK